MLGLGLGLGDAWWCVGDGDGDGDGDGELDELDVLERCVPGAGGSTLRGIGDLSAFASAVGAASPATHCFHDMFQSAMPGSARSGAAPLL